MKRKLSKRWWLFALFFALMLNGGWLVYLLAKTPSPVHEQPIVASQEMLEPKVFKEPTLPNTDYLQAQLRRIEENKAGGASEVMDNKEGRDEKPNTKTISSLEGLSEQELAKLTPEQRSRYQRLMAEFQQVSDQLELADKNQSQLNDRLQQAEDMNARISATINEMRPNLE